METLTRNALLVVAVLMVSFIQPAPACGNRKLKCVNGLTMSVKGKICIDACQDAKNRCVPCPQMTQAYKDACQAAFGVDHFSDHPLAQGMFKFSNDCSPYVVDDE